MERKLLLLGLLRAGDAHGYHIMEMLEIHAGMSISLKMPTAYRLLDEMMQDGWLTSREEKEGKRPARKVYTPTPEGERQFFHILVECLGQYHPAEFHHDISLMFMGELDPEVVTERLKERLSIITDLLENLSEAVKAHGGNFVLAHQLRHLELDHEYIRNLIETFENKGENSHE